MNDELQLTEEDLKNMADKLIEEAAGADIAGQEETELILTGRNLPEALIPYADYISKVDIVKKGMVETHSCF